eukprot:2963325-Prymnesium_polylepis.1
MAAAPATDGMGTWCNVGRVGERLGESERSCCARMWLSIAQVCLPHIPALAHDGIKPSYRAAAPVRLHIAHCHWFAHSRVCADAGGGRRSAASGGGITA